MLKILDLVLEGIKSQNDDLKLEKLDYGFDSIGEFIDSETMEIHYNKHYKGYLEKANELLGEKGIKIDSIDKLNLKVNGLGKKLKTQIGGIFNHEIFWRTLTPDKSKRKFDGEIKRLIEKQFGSLEKFKEEFDQEALNKVGSGWCWVILKPNNRLKIMTTSNQDNPKMNIFLTKDKNEEGGIIYKPITGKILFGLDLWEHAYYLKYRNKKEEYIKNFWKVINWNYINSIIDKD